MELITDQTLIEASKLLPFDDIVDEAQYDLRLELNVEMKFSKKDDYQKKDQKDSINKLSASFVFVNTSWFIIKKNDNWLVFVTDSEHNIKFILLKLGNITVFKVNKIDEDQYSWHQMTHYNPLCETREVCFKTSKLAMSKYFVNRLMKMST